MIKISRLADYGLVMLHGMAEPSAGCLSAAALAERTGISLPTVSKVLKLLNDSGLVTSTRGSAGGYRLAKDPEQISVADVISAVDGAPALTECCDSNSGCMHDARCQLRSHWPLINRVIIKALSQFSLADLKRPLKLMQEIPIQFYSRENDHVE